MSVDRGYVEKNRQELARMRALVARLSDDELRRQANAEWTIAATLLHVAYWDARALWLADKIRRGEPFTKPEEEPDPPTWVNDTVRPFLHAIPPREGAELAVRMGEQCDGVIASLPADRVWPNDQTSLLNAFRSEHRREHLDAIEASLAR